MRGLLNRLFGTLALISSDIFLIVLAFVFAMFIRDLLALIFPLPVLQTQDPLLYQLSNWWIVPLYLIIFAVDGLYDKHRPFWQETRVLFRSIALAALFIYSFISLGKIEDYVSRTLFVLHPLILLVVLPLSRRLLKSILYRVKYWQTQIVEIRIDTDYSLDFTLARNTFIGYHVAETKKISLASLNTKSVTQEIKALLKKNASDTLLVVVKDLASQEISRFIERIYFIAPHVLVVPEKMDLDVVNADIHYLMYDNTFMFDIKKGINSPSGQFIKRIFDIVISSLAIILFSPVLLIIALKIYFTDGFPIFYNHARYGRHGKIFTFHKFRSMKNEKYPDENYEVVKEFLKDKPKEKEIWDAHQKIDEAIDPRILKGLHVIRKTSVDELAQFFNVLKGEMSIVGPRPFMPREREMIGDYFDRILAAKPGITDLWTVSGRDSLTFEQRLKMSTWYVQNWTLWLDFVIIAKTIQQVILYAFKWLRR